MPYLYVLCKCPLIDGPFTLLNSAALLSSEFKLVALLYFLQACSCLLLAQTRKQAYIFYKKKHCYNAFYILIPLKHFSAFGFGGVKTGKLTFEINGLTSKVAEHK